MHNWSENCASEKRGTQCGNRGTVATGMEIGEIRYDTISVAFSGTSWVGKVIVKHQGNEVERG